MRKKKDGKNPFGVCDSQFRKKIIRQKDFVRYLKMTSIKNAIKCPVHPIMNNAHFPHRNLSVNCKRRIDGCWSDSFK
jgi:hypothetical protein